MYRKITLRGILSCICFIQVITLTAQIKATFYGEAGQTVVSDGLTAKTAVMADGRFGDYSFSTGLQFDLISNSNRAFSGYFATASWEFMIRSFPIEIRGFYIFAPYSQLLKETNWGLVAGVRGKHITFRLGTDFRTYAYTRKAARTYELGSDNKIHENWNPAYSLRGFIMPIDHYWNIGFEITNIDHFTVSQDTNPLFNLRMTYGTRTAITCFLEGWYKSSGALNLKVNHFGYFFRTGITWTVR